jgi:hypothetical protein
MTQNNFNRKQKIFREMTLGILIYAVILGFFEDYTNILSTWSYSVTFFVAVVMQILTYITFWLKSKIVTHFRKNEGKKYVAAIILGVWAVMFFSKFVFLYAIEFIFRSSVELSGFIGLIIIIVSMSIVKKLINMIYIKLD